MAVEQRQPARTRAPGETGSADCRNRHDPTARPDVSFTEVTKETTLARFRRREAALLDATGRKVMELQEGPNDIRHLAPGVYFLKDEGGRLKDEPGGRTAVRKVVVQR
jgi:hypothetical protein